jgi:hypothetical protein
MSQSQFWGSHTIKWEHKQTSLETLGTKLERLGSKAEASTKELEQHRGRLRHTRSTGHKHPGHPEASRAAPGHLATSVQINLPLWVTWPQMSRSPRTSQKTAHEFAPNFRSMDLPNHLESWDHKNHRKNAGSKRFGTRLRRKISLWIS